MTAESVVEGAIRLDIPMRPDGDKGPATIGEGPFYNPAMRFNRDLSVLAVESHLQARRHERPYVVYDGLAASGARGIRLAKECRPRDGQAIRVVLNDRSEDATRRIRAHAASNGVSDRVDIRCDDFSDGFGGERFDHVDIDPFGSPMPFVDAALRHVRTGGIVAATATDVAALCGVHPGPCRRRYDAVPWHGAGMHEVALRILAGAITRHAARFDKEAVPVLVHATDHYVRVYMRVRRGARRADAALQQVGYAAEGTDGTRRVHAAHERIPAGARRVAGPLWIGPLFDAPLLLDLKARLPAHPQLDERPLARYLDLAMGEAGAPPLLYSIGDLTRTARTSAPRMDALLERLRNLGFQAARSHTDPGGIKTDAPCPAVLAALDA